MKKSLDEMRYELTLPKRQSCSATTRKAKGGDVSPEERQKNLEAFLKDSKVKDCVYHGTPSNEDFREFKPTRIGEFGPAIYFSSSPEDASDYSYAPRSKQNEVMPRVLPVHLNITNPFTEGVVEFWKAFGRENETDAMAIQRAKDAGYDGIIEPKKDWRGKVHHHYIVFHPHQIKSAIANRGTFNPNDPDITKAGGGEVDPDIRKKLDEFKEKARINAELHRRYRESYIGKPMSEQIPYAEWLANQNKLAIGGQGSRNWLKGDNDVENFLEPLLQRHVMGGDPARKLAEMHRQYTPEYMAELPDNIRQNIDEAFRTMQNMVAANNWVKGNLSNYVKKQMGTHEDPVRHLADQGILHYEPNPIGFVGKRDYAIGARARAGEEPAGLAKTDLGALWEDIPDNALETYEARRFQNTEQHNKRNIISEVIKNNSWLQNVKPDTNVHALTTSVRPYHFGFDHIMDVLKEDLATGRIRPEQLNKVSMADAVRRTHEYNEERKRAMAEARIAARADLPIHKEYPTGFKWIELNKPGSFSQESDMMGHSVRGYEPPKGHPDWIPASGDSGYLGYGKGGWEGIKSGKAKVYSLVDPKGEPHVTIETYPHSIRNFNDVNASIGVDAARQLYEETKHMTPDQLDSQWGELTKNMPLVQEINQIKGKGNAKPIANYIPYVQDFVKSGNWSHVNDLQNSDLIHHQGQYLTPEEHKALIPKKASGGIMRTPTMAEMRMALLRQNPLNLQSYGANEAPSMDPKAYLPPDVQTGSFPPPGGVATPHGLPIGGIDMNPMQPGQQLMPQGMPQNAPQAPQGAPQPPQGGNASPLTQGPSNILQMTPQGRAMSAMTPPQVPGMKDGGSQPKEEKPLIVLHNTSSRKLGLADKLGGFSVPSLAIVNPEIGFHNFGDISLIGHPDMAKPSRDNPVFASDVYSPRFPSLNDEGDKIFRGYTPLGNRRYAPLTLENAVREMKGNVRGGEGYGYGPGSIRSSVTPQFKNIGQIKKSRNRIISTENFRPMADATHDQLFDLWRKFHPHSIHSGNWFEDTSNFADRLQEAGTEGIHHLRQYYKDTLPPELLEDAQNYLHHLKNMPTEYFEAKPQRGVKIHEFVGAVIPHNQSEELAPLLAKHGISRIETYHGDNEDELKKNRIKALGKFSDHYFEYGGAVRSKTTHIATNPDTMKYELTMKGK